MLEARVVGLPVDVLEFRPRYPEAWTIKEHVIHLADSEANNFIRLKSIIAQPGSVGFVIDEIAWTSNLAHKREDIGKYLRLFRVVREIVVELVSGEIGSNENFFLRTYRGETRRVTLREGLEVYARHVGFHLEYIDRILRDKSC
jgi:DinB superfamily